MTIGLIFWILMLIWVVFTAWSSWPTAPQGPHVLWGSSVLLFVLFMLLGWATFGPPIRG